MGKFLVRITILSTSIYFILSHLIAQIYGVDILCDLYSIPFMLIVVVYCYSEGRYHCKHIKHLSFALLLSDLLSRLDNYYNFLTISKHNFSILVILLLGFMASTISAVRHFLRVNKVKQMRKKSGHNNDNNERDKNVGNQDS
jgi:hypothetical protein